ncbi:lysozyme X [Drosophila ficusphila]|uniref:lysozyme X n=1 Tax=Drosophila ficusphila TaxID=30025 RepID=UPI0007E6EFA6|nr:lysozyme X [Drosophila ficusphila]
MRAALVICVLAVAISVTLARTMDRCSLAREMYRLGVPKSQLARWTCIARHESDYRTHVVGPPNSDGSNDYGIFQINDRYWCQPASGKYSSNGCNINCNELLTDNIRNSVRCAQKVQGEQGWTAWATWEYCSGPLPSIDDCFNCNSYERDL